MHRLSNAQGVTKVTVVNRSEQKVLDLQAEFPNVEIVLKLIPDMWDVIKNSDIVYPSTDATTTIINAPELRACLEAGGRDRPGGIQFVDISVPRNVNTDCEEVRNIIAVLGDISL
jgi:glutamyl-tRNA reductase